MNIVLKRKIKVNVYKAILDVGQKQERSDVIALLLIAKANNNQLSKQIICRDFLFRDHEQMAENVLRRCIDYEVIDNDYKVTKKGFEALEDRMVYQYYDGVFYVYVTTDPLIPQKILNYKIIEENINFGAEIRGSSGDLSNLIDTPQWLKDLENIEGEILFNDAKTEITIKAISEKVEFIEEEFLHVSINLSEKSCALIVSDIFNDQRNIDHFPDFKEVLNELLGDQISNWNWNENKLEVSSNLTDNEKLAFKKKITFNNPKIKKFGTFDSFSIEVDIKPQTEALANEWANFLLLNNINDFLFENTLKEQKQKIAVLFPEYTINFLNRTSIAQLMKVKMQSDEIPIEYWFVQAPIDIAPIINKESN